MKNSFWVMFVGVLTLGIVALSVPGAAQGAILLQYNFGNPNAEDPVGNPNPSYQDQSTIGSAFSVYDGNANDIQDHFGLGSEPPALFMSYGDMTTAATAPSFGTPAFTSTLPNGSTTYFQFTVLDAVGFNLTLTELSVEFVRVGGGATRDVEIGLYESSDGQNTWTLLNQTLINSAGSGVFSTDLSLAMPNSLQNTSERVFRFYLVDHGSTTSTFGFGLNLDNLELDGIAVVTPELPSFSIWGLGAVGLVIGAGFRRVTWRRKN